jgi:hypothetical protein
MVPFSRRVSPALVVAALALFLAAGGSGYAIGKRVTPQARCQAGAVRGIAVVTGSSAGIANLPDDYSSDQSLFGFRFNCTGGAIQVKKAPSLPGGADVRFVGNAASAAIVTAVGGTPGEFSATKQPDGSFRVVAAGPAGPSPSPIQIQPTQFVIVLV